MAQQQQALFAEQQQRYLDFEQVLDRTAEDFDQLGEDYQKAIDELRLLRRWIYGLRRERHVADAKQQHLFEMGALFAEPLPSAKQSPASSDVPASAEDAAQAAAAAEKAARRRKKRADRKLCLDAIPQTKHDHDVSDFTDASILIGPEFRELGMSLANQLPVDALTAMLPDHWAAAHPK